MANEGAKIQRKFDAFLKLSTKGADACDLHQPVSKFFEPPIRVVLIETGELKLKGKFEDPIDPIERDCKKAKKKP